MTVERFTQTALEQIQNSLLPSLELIQDLAHAIARNYEMSYCQAMTIITEQINNK